MSKEEILDYFRHINTVYNDCSMHDSLSNMLDEFEQETYGKGYNQGTIDRAEELQKCREYGYNKAIDECYMKAKTMMEELAYQNQGRRNGKTHRVYCIQALEFLRQVVEELKGVQE